MPAPLPIHRFGPYELRTRTRELYKEGVKLKLRPQPYRVLQILVERAGDAVTREELRQLLWAAETFVDFEHGLNTAIKELRAALSDSADEPRYIETLPKLGYRLIAPVEVGRAVAASAEKEAPKKAREEQAVAQSEPANVPGRAVERFRPWMVPVVARMGLLGSIAVLGGVLLTLSVASFVAWRHFHPPARRPAERILLAVLPFQNLTGDPAQDYFSDGLTEEMISQLGRFDPQHLGVIARTSVMHYKNRQEPLDRIAGALGVEYLLEGSVRRDSNKVRIAAQLVQAKDQTHVWAREYDRELSNLLALQAEIAQEIADEIHLTLGERNRAERARRPSAPPPTSEAYDLYLRGRYFWNKRTPDGFKQAADYFQQAIAIDPNYARAYAGLADTFGLMSTWFVVPQNEFMPKARAAALKALQIDETLAEAHTSLALVAENYDYDWQTAEKEFRRGIQLYPGYATAHQWYAECLSLEGRFDEALAESDRARQLDPLSVIIAIDHGAILYYSRQYDRAIQQLRVALDMDPKSVRAAGLMMFSYVQENRFADALAQIESWRRTNNKPSDWLGVDVYVYGRWGRQAQAQHAFARLQKFIRHSQLDMTAPLLLAYLGMGRKDQAIALLQKSYAERSNAVVALKVEPNFDPLRSDPRFQELLRRVRLAE